MTIPHSNLSRTKKKDIYVISTPKRPVPLEHYLYAGRDVFKIVDANRQFLTQGYVRQQLCKIQELIRHQIQRCWRSIAP